MNERRVDGELLIFASLGRVCCTVAEAVLRFWEEKLQVPLNLLTKELFDKEVVSVRASLDVPTFDDRVVKGKLNGATSGSRNKYCVVWGSLSFTLSLLSSATRLITEFGVLSKVISSQQDGISFAIAHLGQELLKIILAPNWQLSRAHGLSRYLLLFCGQTFSDDRISSLRCNHR